MPDAKTLWRYRESLKSAAVFDRLFAELARQIAAEGFVARKGQIIDASLVAAPVQRNRRTENAQIKEGEVPADLLPPRKVGAGIAGGRRANYAQEAPSGLAVTLFSIGGSVIH